MQFFSKTNFISLSLVALFFMSSCDKNDSDVNGKTNQITPKPTFVLNSNEESMPVWVNGNNDSQCVILVIHGGPGSDVLDFRTYKNGLAFKKIEETTLVAYWQQRAAGQSVGSDNQKYFTIDQYVDDADKVVDQLRNKYPGKKIVLFAHSWGGMLSSSYLKDETRRTKIAAWIDAAGVHNGTNLIETTTADINAEADIRIAANENVADWKEVKTDLASNPNLYNKIAYALTQIIPEVLIKVDNDDFKFTERAISSNSLLFKEIVHTNNAPVLSNITMPCLLLWGKYDFAVSKTYRKEFLANIGSKEVRSVDFNASGHYMMFHEPDLFAKSVIDFLNLLE
jgi:pimeloyl-ACP methyl ester carboxylesterase